MTRWRCAGYAATALLVLAWQIASGTGVLPPDHAASPMAVARELAAQWTQLSLAAMATLGRTLLAFALGGCLGTALGLGHGLSSGFRSATGPLIEGLRPLPSVALIPAAMLVCGMGGTLNTVIAAFACTWPVFISARDGVAGISPVLADSARTLGADRRRMVLDIILPGAFPMIVTGLRIGLAVAFAVQISVEMLVPENGLGALAATAALAARTPLLYTAMVVSALAGFALNHLFRLFERRVLRRYGPQWGTP
jgi:NitT/TauT family transport system permease protein